MDPTAERTIVLAELEDAVTQLEQSMSQSLVPPEGAAICYAIRGARDSGGVAAPAHQIRVLPDGTLSGRPCRFGADESIARVLLSAMKSDPAVRSCASIAHTPRAESVLCDDLFLASASCEHQEARDSGPMDWGVASCCRNGVPDVIICRDMKKNRVRIYLFGERPADVASNIIICSNRI